jgi:type II secretory pathway pseudopilin PulG
MAEILMVIVIISILAAFLLPAVVNSHRQAKVAACKSEVKSLGMAIDAFQSDFGEYPPTDFAFNTATGQFDGPAYGDYAYSEALVQCLGNKFTRGVGDSDTRGINRIIGGAPVNSGPYFEMKVKQLTDLDFDGYPELADEWGNPYIYIPEDDYLVLNAGDGEYYYNAGALLKTAAGLNASGHPDLTISAQDSPALNTHEQRFSFQLISRGPDGWTPGIDHRDLDGDPKGLPDGTPPSAANFNPSLIGTDTDPSSPFISADWGHTEETADDINNWSD